MTDEIEFTTAELMTVQIAQLISLKLLRLTLTEDVQIGAAEIWHKYEFLQQNLKERYKSVPFTGWNISDKIYFNFSKRWFFVFQEIKGPARTFDPNIASTQKYVRVKEKNRSLKLFKIKSNQINQHHLFVFWLIFEN